MIKKLLKELILTVHRFFYKKTIIFENVNGFTGNSGALYDYLIQCDKYKNYKFVWLVEEKNSYNSKKRWHTSVVNIWGKSIKRSLYLYIADIIFFDNYNVPKYREFQKKYYLTHGAPPLKNVKGLINLPSDVDNLICGSRNVIDVISYQYSAPKEKFVILGYPRNDYLFKCDKNTQEYISNLEKRIIIWAPTFRKKKNSDRRDSNKEFPLGIPLLDSKKEFELLLDYLKANNITIILKTHPSSDISQINVKQSSNFKLLSQDDLESLNINLYSLMGKSHAMLTDYSTIAFDYLLLDKPIGYIVDDIKDYKLGFAFDNYFEMMPGMKINKFDELLKFLDNVISDNDEYKMERKKIRDFTNDYVGNDNCKKIAEYFDL